ncbi:gamma-glutamyltransferase [bacterium]|nr:gamma-glutamyltransferase [bacterium]
MPLSPESGFPYPSQRMPIFARECVATSQPLAAQAGLDALARGGNAADAALAAAITLTVVEPTSNGIGSDAFALVWEGKSLHGLNASGRSPAGWTRERFAGLTEMPERGWDSVTVPGCVSAWVALSERHGRLPFGELFTAAIRHAREGYLVSPITAAAWQRSEPRFRDFAEFARVFLPSGRAPMAGETIRLPDHAATLIRIAESGGEDFYRGELARRIAAASEADGGAMCFDDLASHLADWVAPISIEYRGHVLHEIPPNGQGLAALIALGILREVDMAAAPVDSVASFHLQIEAMKLALADAYRHLSDPAHMQVPVEALLSPDYLASRAQLIDPKRARAAEPGVPAERGTVYLTAADRDGMMVSFIQSNYWGFGSGVVAPGTGIALQNRGFGFVLTPGHPNEVGPRKRPFHTIIPGFLTRDGQPVLSFGVMGGPMQTQGHVQMVVRFVDYGQNIQTMSDAPRWQVTRGLGVMLESTVPLDTVEGLRALGHEVTIAPPREFGGAQLIQRLPDGYCAASDHRKDGQAVGR